MNISELVVTNNDAKQHREKLLKLIIKKGHRREKRHGQWIKLEIKKDLFFELDSWNGEILLKRGSGDYCRVLGFSGDVIYNYGMDFGGLMIPKSAKMGNYHIYNELYSDAKITAEAPQ